MHRFARWSLQAVLYAAFAAAVGVFSGWPPYRQLGPEQALLRLSLLHPGAPLHDCRQRSPEELAKLPAHMRVAQDCPRERSPVHVRVTLDDRPVIDETFAPSGLARDGAAAAYRRLVIPAGTHRIGVGVNDDARHAEVFRTADQTLQIAPGQVVLIDFDPRRGGVLIR
ncbi:MAG TPA: hypothetical protein VLW55_26320 [Burkholderiaceae bacterium]|nr:hypothetical protein [Burkholderiaceae bacterium]